MPTVSDLLAARIAKDSDTDATAAGGDVKEEDHTPVRIWQERRGEFTYVCSCGMHMKHQQFGEWPACADDPLATTSPTSPTDRAE